MISRWPGRPAENSPSQRRDRSPAPVPQFLRFWFLSIYDALGQPRPSKISPVGVRSMIPGSLGVPKCSPRPKSSQSSQSKQSSQSNQSLQSSRFTKSPRFPNPSNPSNPPPILKASKHPSIQMGTAECAERLNKNNRDFEKK